MWNENKPLELLKDMPQVLDEKNLADIQLVIDEDKYVNSWELGRDLCGEYAPFCANCDKSLTNPCAVSYVKMKISEGMQVKIASEEEPEVKPVECKKIRIAIARRKVGE